MELQKIEKAVEKEYHVSWYIICYKFLLGLIESAFGIGILLFGKNIVHTYMSFASQELSEDPHDLLVHLTEGIIPQLFTHNTYIVFYLLLLGTAKMAGTIGLMYKKNWGVDLLVIMTIVLLHFQVVNLFIHPSVFDSIYIATGLLIAFYLIEFKPKAWISRMLLRWGRLKESKKLV